MADLVYTGIGSRRTPSATRAQMTQYARALAERGYTLRSGGAPGADQAFELGAGGNREIYLPWSGFEGRTTAQAGMLVLDDAMFERAIDIVRDIHPNWKAVEASRGSVRLQARDAFQILGVDLATPSQFVVCWAPIKGDSIDGGTRTAFELARACGIPAFNLAVARDQHALDFELDRQRSGKLLIFDMSRDDNQRHVLVHGPGSYGAEFATTMPLRAYALARESGEVREPHYLAGPFVSEREADIERMFVHAGGRVETLEPLGLVQRAEAGYARMASTDARASLRENHALADFREVELKTEPAISVGNIQREGRDAGEYIGRPWRGVPGSPLGNIFSIGRDGTRDEVVDKYRDWIGQQIRDGDHAIVNELQRLADVAERQPLRVLCHCAPDRCHGDVVRELVRDLVLERAAALTRPPPEHTPLNGSQPTVTDRASGDRNNRIMADLTNEQIAALSRGFYELSQRELRVPGGVLPPRPNAVSAILGEEIAAGRLVVNDGRFTVADDRAREQIIERVRDVLDDAVRVNDPAVALHAQTPRSDYSLILQNSPTVFDPVTGDMVFLDAAARDATVERVKRCKDATTIADQNIRYCYADLNAFGGKYLPDVAIPTVVMPNAVLTGDALALVHDASRPAPHRIEKLANTLEAGPGRALASVPEGSTRPDIVKQLNGLTRYELERLDDSVNRLLFEVKRNARDQRPRPRDGRALNATERAQETLIVDLFRRDQQPEALRERTFTGGPSPTDPASAQKAHAVARLDDPAQRAFLQDRAQIEKQVEFYNNDAPPDQQLRAPTDIGERFTGTVALVSRHHFALRRNDGRYAVVPIKQIASTTIGVRGTAQDGPPLWKLLNEISRVGAQTTVRAGGDGLLAFKSERPQTVVAQRKRAEEERRGNNLQYEEQREIQHDLAVTLENGRNAYARAHDRAPQALGTMALADREENAVYRGPIVDVGRWHFAQAVGGQIVPHEMAAFDRTPAVGENWAITYPEGSQMERGQANVSARRDDRVAEFVSRSMPELVDDRSRAELNRQLAVATRIAADLTGQSVNDLNALTLDPGDRAKYAGSIVHAGSQYSFMLVDESKLVTLDHRRLGRSFDVGDQLTIRSDRTVGITVGDVVRSEARVDRERSAAFDDRQLAASEAMALAQRRIGDEHVAKLLGVSVETVRDRVQPGRDEPARLLLATSAATYFGIERDGETRVCAVPTYHEGKLADGIEVALGHTDVSLTRAAGVIEIAPRGDMRVLGSAPIHTFRELAGRRDGETGKYIGDRYVGTIASVEGPAVIIDVGNYDLLAIDREELLETGAVLEVGQPVTVDYSNEGISINDRPVEQELAKDRPVEQSRER